MVLKSSSLFYDNNIDVLLTIMIKKIINSGTIQTFFLVFHILDKMQLKFVVSLPLNAAQGSHSAAPIGRG